MRDNLRRELTLGMMARLVNLTPEHLCRAFKAETGGTPVNYLKWLRIQRAKELLETTHLSVKEIMLVAGVKDESHFRRDFRKACGKTPHQYRAKYHVVNLTGQRQPRPPSKSATKYQYSPLKYSCMGWLAVLLYLLDTMINDGFIAVTIT